MVEVELEPLRVVAERDTETHLWLVASVDRPFLTQARSLEEVPRALQAAHGGHEAFARKRGFPPFTGRSYPPLPARYTEAFETGRSAQRVALNGGEVVAELRIASG